MRLVISPRLRGGSLFAAASLLIATAGLLVGCMPTQVVPPLETAQTQYNYAYSAELGDIPPVHPGQLIKHRKKQRVKYEKVIERFPDDPVYTPEAIIAVSRMMGIEGRFKDIGRYLDKARPLYPNHDFFQARALKLLGMAADSRQKHEKAKEYYAECKDRYNLSRNPAVAQIAAECNTLFYRAYINIR